MTEHSIFDTGAATPGHPLRHLADSLTAHLARKRDRRAFKQMLNLDDQVLNDMGVTRHEVEYASRLPLSVDAATELRRISLERRRRRD